MYVTFLIVLYDNDLTAGSNTSADSSLIFKYVWNSNELESYQSALQSNDVQSALNNHFQGQIMNIENYFKAINNPKDRFSFPSR